jgi:predicted nucleic acid-binding protein
MRVPELILDAWPVMEWLKGREPAVWLFRGIIDDAVDGRNTLSMCRINYGEVIYSIRKSLPPAEVELALKAFHQIPIRIDSVDDTLIDAAVELKSVYQISYADAFAASYAMRRGLALVTGDRELLPLAAVGLRLHWIGQ